MSAVEVALGAILGIGGTVVGVYATHYFEERREDRKVKAEEWKTVVDEVYSPLMFDLRRVQQGILLILGSLGRSLDKSDKFPEDQVAGSITKIAQFQSQHTQSQIFEDILRKRSRLIKPSSLWLDLYMFYSYLNWIEQYFSIISVGMFKESAARLITAVKSAAKVGELLGSAVLSINAAIEKLVILTPEVPKSPSYTTFFTDGVRAKIDQQNELMIKSIGSD